MNPIIEIKSQPERFLEIRERERIVLAHKHILYRRERVENYRQTRRSIQRDTKRTCNMLTLIRNMYKDLKESTFKNKRQTNWSKDTQTRRQTKWETEREMEIEKRTCLLYCLTKESIFLQGLSVIYTYKAFLWLTRCPKKRGTQVTGPQHRFYLFKPVKIYWTKCQDIDWHAHQKSTWVNELFDWLIILYFILLYIESDASSVLGKIDWK